MMDPRMKGRPAGMPPPPMDAMFTDSMPQMQADGMEAGSPLGGIATPNAAVPPPPAPPPSMSPMMPTPPAPPAATAPPSPAGMMPQLQGPAQLFPSAPGSQLGAIQRKLQKPGY